MTKIFLCVKIYVMNTCTSKQIRKIFILLLSLAVLVCSALLACPICFSASASIADATANQFLPITEMEYKKLSSPIDVYSDDTVTAIAQGTDVDPHTLTVYFNGKYSTVANFISLKQVKRMDTDSLFILDNGGAFKISLTDLENHTAKEPLYYTVDGAQDTIRGNYFDLNDNYLVTAFGVKGMIYTRNQSQFSHVSTDTFTVKQDSPIALNNNGDIFFVNGDGLCMTNVTNLNSITVLLRSVSPAKMIANEQYLYYIVNTGLGNFLYRLDHTTQVPAQASLSVNDCDAKFDLGNLSNPSGLTFRGENLFISEGNTIQEFAVDGNTLTFTGFAIAREKTAYNRVGSTAIDVEKYGNQFAVLDKSKLTVITPSDSVYARENYINYSSEIKLDGALPNAFALGNGKAVLSYSHGSSTARLAMLDFNDEFDKQTKTLFTGNIIHDITYQSGYFYALADNGNVPSVVYRCSENDFEFTEIARSSEAQFKNICVDVYGNVYLGTSDKIVALKKSENYLTATDVYSGFRNIKKITSDLGGELFVLDETGINYVYEDNGAFLSTALAVNGVNGQIKTFAMNFDCNKVYLMLNSDERVYSTDTLPNLALSNLAVPSDFATTANNAQLDKLKVYTALSGSNVYNVTQNETKFVFNGIIESGNEYAFISDVTDQNAFGVSVSFTALAGRNSEGRCELVLVDKTCVKDITDSTINLTTTPAKVFVTTDCNAYYLPILTFDGDYALVDTDVISLLKGSVLEPTNKITMLGADFYYGMIKLSDGRTCSGYVPVNFTVEVLSQDFKWAEYTIHQTKATMLYSDDGLSVNILDLSDGQSVRVFESTETYVKVAVNTENGWIIGYVSSSALQNDAYMNVRNIIIILAVAVCVFGTTLFFVLRKKKL